MLYQSQWGSTHPGCVIILIDQSGSMSDAFGGGQVGAGTKKCDWAATAVNGLLRDLVKMNTTGSTIKGRIDIAILGYEGSSVRSALGGPLAGKDFLTLQEINDNPLRIDATTKKEVDGTGQVIEIPVFVPVWVEPIAGGGTPMVQALQRAKDLAEKWVREFPSKYPSAPQPPYPPTIINVTDGAATDGDITGPARDIARISTADGNALLYNCHITNISAAPVAFPTSAGQLPADPTNLASLLFSVSSEIPDSARKNLEDATGTKLNPGARGMIFNGDAVSIPTLFKVGTLGPAIDPNK